MQKYNLKNRKNSTDYKDWNNLRDEFLNEKSAWEKEIQSLIDNSQ